MAPTKNISISEYGYIGYGSSYEENTKYSSAKVSQDQFKELEQFHKNNPDFFEYKNDHTLKTKGNYVGIIQTKNLTLEILPKIYTINSNEKDSRDIFVKMLLTIDNIPTAKDGTNADVDSAKMNIFEIFIKLFIKHIDELIRKGVKSDYVTVEDNLNYLKGKIQFSNHIRYNLAHKEKFYVEYDEYIEDRVENRLLKTCIEFLLSKSTNFQNQSALRQQLFFFDNVSYSTNIENDLSCIEYLHRGMEHYELPLKFAKIFLQNRSFTPIKGENSSFSLLFQMNIIFERYIAKLLQEQPSILDLQTSMKKQYSLLKECDTNQKKIEIEPDYKMKINKKIVIGDAKWKLIEQDNQDMKISPNDVYQIYSYLHYFNSDTGIIFTPKLYEDEKKVACYTFEAYKNIDTEKKLYICYVDLSKNEIAHNFKEIQ